MFFVTFSVHSQDDCATSVTVSDLTGTICATSSPGSTEVLVGSDCEEGTIDTWFQFTAQGTTGDITVSSDVSNWGPEFMILGSNTNDCSPTGGLFDNLGCVDQNGNYNSITSPFNGLVAGDTYFIVVTSNFDNTTGTISVCVNNPLVVAACVDNDECLIAEVLALPGSDSGPLCLTDCNAGASVGPNFTGCDGHLGATVWYEFTTDATHATFDLTLTSSDMSTPHFSIYTTADCLTYNTAFPCVQGTGGSASIIGTTDLSPNTTYYIAVSGDAGGDGSFDLCIEQFSDNSPCNTNSDIVESSSSDPITPIGGPYSPGEVVSFCYNVTDWETVNTNWLQGIVPTFGNGWDPSSFVISGEPATIPTPLVTQGVMISATGGYAPCFGETAGWWVWHPAGDVIYNNILGVTGSPGALPDGTPLPGGWFFETTYDIDFGDCGDQNDPNQTFGDNDYNSAGVSTLDWNICITLTAGPVGNCDLGLTDLTVSMQTYADGEIGAWTSVGCVGNVQQTFPASLLCCPAFDVVDVAVCESYTLPAITGSLLSGNEAYYTGPNGTGNQYSATDVITLLLEPGYSTANYMYIYDNSNLSCVSQDSFLITVNNLSVVNIPAIAAACAGSDIVLNENGGEATSWLWSTDGSATFTTNVSQNPTISNGVHGETFQVVGTDVNGCIDSTTYVIAINALPVIASDTTTPTACDALDGSIQVTLTSGPTATGTLSWTGIASGSAAAVLPDDITGLGAGSYNVTFTDANGCISNITSEVLNNPGAPIINAISDTVSCGIDYQLVMANITGTNLTSNLTYYLGTGGTGGVVTDGAIYTPPTNINIFVRDSNGICKTEIQYNILIDAIPTLTLQDTAVCSPATVDITDASVSSTDLGTILYYSDAGLSILVPDPTSVGTGVYYAVATNGTCTSSGPINVAVAALPAPDPLGPITECGSYTLPVITGANLSGSEAYYDATGGPTVANVVTGPITSDMNIFIYDGAAGCSGEEAVSITIDPLPTVTNVSGGGTYCAGDVVADVLVDVTGAANWSVDYTLDGAVQNATGTTSPVNLGNTTGVYVITNVTDANCTNTATGTQTIVVNPIPSAPAAGTDSEYCSTVTFNNMTASGNGGIMTWYSDAGLTSVISVGSTLAPNDGLGATTYYVTETLNGCEGPSSQVIITINLCSITIPTAFTPDGDGVNDGWEILDIDQTYPESIVYIYNRWGNLLFTSVQGDYDNNKWDGTYNGKDLPVGSYYFIIEYNDKENEKINGIVSIILNKQ